MTGPLPGRKGIDLAFLFIDNYRNTV